MSVIEPVIESDGTMENFYRMYKSVYPDGTIRQFQEWFRHVCEVQDQMAGCPWCGVKGSLMVSEHHTPHRYEKGDLRWHTENIADPDRLRYAARCENDECPTQPKIYALYDTPEEARDIWNGRR